MLPKKQTQLSFDKETADVFVFKKETLNQSTTLHYKYKGNTYELNIPFEDKASIENAISCLMLLLYLDYNAIIQSRMLLLFPVEMRLKVKTGINNCSLLMTVIARLQSLEIALDFLESQTV
jgi:alanine racemase